MSKISPFLWFDKEAEDAAKLYVSLFPNSRIVSVNRYPTDVPQAGAKAGDVMTVAFELDGQPITGMNGGPAFTFDEAVSFVIDCDGQDEVDHYWNGLIADGGQESQCGWLKDRFGVSWQVVPVELMALLRDPDPERAQRATQAMLQMRRIDLDGIRRAADTVDA